MPIDLKTQIAEAEQAHRNMIEATRLIVTYGLNRAIRFRQMPALLGQQFTKDLIRYSQVFATGFPGFDVAASARNIRRMRDRLGQEELKLTAPRQYSIGATRIVENPEKGRLQIIFNGIPAYELRQRMRAEGFRWEPGNEAWERSLCPEAKDAVRRVFQPS